MSDQVDIWAATESDSSEDIFVEPSVDEPADIFVDTSEPDPLPSTDDTLYPDDISIHPQDGPEYEPSPEGEPLYSPPELPEGWTPGGPERG